MKILNIICLLFSEKYDHKLTLCKLIYKQISPFYKLICYFTSVIAVFTSDIAILTRDFENIVNVKCYLAIFKSSFANTWLIWHFYH